MGVNMVIVNLTNHTLRYASTRGDDVKKGPDPVVGPGQAGAVAIFSEGGGRWDWVYLTDDDSGLEYQLYIEETAVHTRYTFFGFRDDNSTEKDSNPKPFADGTDMCYWGGQTVALYTLIEVPIQTNGQAAHVGAGQGQAN
jgi:hypothetical protein